MTRASILMVLATCLVAGEPPAPPPLALPSGEQVAPLIKAVRAAFKADYANRDPEARRVLVRRLIGEGALGEPPARCAALREAVDQAARLGDVPLIDEAVTALAAAFLVDARTERLAALATAAAANPPPESLASLFDAVLMHTEAAIEADDFAGALQAAQQAETMARRLRDPAAAARVRQTLARCKELAEEWKRVGPLTDLLGEPDPAAAQRLARFRCLYQGAWSTGLSGLAAGADPALQAAAAVELAAQTPQQRVAAGIAWAEVGSRLRGLARDNVLLHAVHLLRPALAELPTIERGLGEKRLAELVKQLGPAARLPDLPPGALVYLTCERDAIVDDKGRILVQDVSGGGNHGTLAGGKPSQGPWGGALAFTGESGQGLDLGATLSARLTGSLTVAMWLRPANFSARRNPFCVRSNGIGAITQETGGTLTFYWGAGGPNSSLGSGTPLRQEAWTHIAVVRDFSARSLVWYLDGAAVAKAATQFPAAAPDALPVLIGSGYAGSYAGLIDEIGIWPRGLSAAEVAGLRASTQAGR